MLRRIFVVCSGLASIAAGNTAVLAEAVTIRVRAIRASGIDPSTATSFGDPTRTREINCPRTLGDINGKLSKLPYNSFSLVSSQTETIDLMKKETLYLTGGNELTIRPLYSENGKVGLWLRWIDSDGAKVLDTRMHLATGESMVAGAEVTDAGNAGDDNRGPENTGTEHRAAMVLAIDVSP